MAHHLAPFLAGVRRKREGDRVSKADSGVGKALLSDVLPRAW